jgi:hypothetical protein
VWRSCRSNNHMNARTKKRKLMSQTWKRRKQQPYDHANLDRHGREENRQEGRNRACMNQI